MPVVNPNLYPLCVVAARWHPLARGRSGLALTLAEREDNFAREIARRLDRAASTVSREIGHHGGRPAYRLQIAAPLTAIRLDSHGRFHLR